MFKETLLITPKLTPSDLSTMEKSLQGRFTKVAQGFGKGLLSVLGGAGVAGLVGGAIGSAIGAIYDRLVAPLKETQSAIETQLKKSDDLTAQAKAFGSSSGQLQRLQAFGQATGVDSGTLSVLIQKFQGAVAEAVADPNKATSVRRFVGNKDTVEAFFQYIQGLQGLNANDRTRAQTEVFGEKQILKIADFLQSDFGALAKRLGGPTATALTKSNDKLNRISDLADEHAASRGLNDTPAKARLINDSILGSIDKQAAFDLEVQNKRIASFDAIAATALTAEKINQKIDDIILKLGDLVLGSKTLTAHAKGIENAPVVRLPGKKFGEF